MRPEEFLFQMQQSFLKDLPGAAAHRLMMPAKRPIEASEISDLETYRTSAVAIVCYPDEGMVNGVLIQRPEYEGTHGGQMSFPGGKSDPEDASLEHTARRETFEEIGWSLDNAQLLGKLTEMYVPVSRFIVHPFVFFVPEKMAFIPDAREVAEIVPFKIHHLLQPDVIQRSTIKLSTGISIKDVPYFDLSGKRVWGATAIILSEFRALLNG